jgi:hypothetical protein
MKKTALLLCLLLNITIKVKDNHFRTDIADQFSSITDLATGDTITLIHAKKAYIKLTGAQMRENIEQRMQASLQGQAPPTAADIPKVVDTGKTEKIGDYTASIYTSQTKLVKFTYWISKDYADYAAVNTQLKNFKTRQSALSDKMVTRNYLVPDTTKLDGVVLKTEIVNDEGTTSRMTLVSAKVEPVDDSVFKIPADYTEVEPPASPAPPSTAPQAAPASTPAPPAPAPAQ